MALKHFLKEQNKHTLHISIALGIVILSSSGHIKANGGVLFTDLASDSASGIDFSRTGVRNDSFLDDTSSFSLKQVMTGSVRLPPMFTDAPGIALFDYDKDGDLDAYVTNYSGIANSLYSNQKNETGKLTFQDMGLAVGVDATTQDSTGVCAGDIDNDGDEDLLVLGGISPNRLYENNAGQNFIEITNQITTDKEGGIASACSMGDVNGDGLLDFVVANSYKILSTGGIGPVYNTLFINQGNNTFKDVSAAAGIHNYEGITWAIALVDLDLDGDMDIVAADDSNGFIRVHNNDGNGNFTDTTYDIATNRPGSWMGLAFADFNSDGNMDIFATNVGDYFAQAFTNLQSPGVILPPGIGASGWFLGQNNGTFIFPGTGSLGATPFGWGTGSADYDNDGDTDVVYYGGMNAAMFADATNPGAILSNDGHANFNRDYIALSQSINHQRRSVRGVALGDFDDNGFIDIASVSAMDWPEPFPLVPIVPLTNGGQFDDAALMWPQFSPVDPEDPSQGYSWNNYDPINGGMALEMNSGGNGNAWVKFDVMGSIDIVPEAQVNRNGIGAVLSFSPLRGKTVMRPITAGSSHGSAHSMTSLFGLGKSHMGNVEIIWPGGTKNRLYGVKAGERLLLPEIPCSYDDSSITGSEYRKCTIGSLRKLVKNEILSISEAIRFFFSAIRARRATL